MQNSRRHSRSIFQRKRVLFLQKWTP